MKVSIKERRAVTDVVKISVGLIIFATLGFTALQMLSTASTTGFSTSVATIAVTVTAILAALAVALSFYKGHKL